MIDGLQPHNNNIINIRTYIDCEVGWNQEQREKYCIEIYNAIKNTYPEYEVTCYITNCMETEVEVSNPKLSFYEKETLKEKCKSICQFFRDERNFLDY